MSLSGYRTFIKIVDTGSLAATAKELHLSPSAVSKQLASLEERLDAKLIQRSTRSIQVTDVGEQFYQRCVAIVQAAQAAESEVRDLTGELDGSLKITLPQAMATGDFSRLLQNFKSAHPAIGLDVKVNNSVNNLIEKDLDVAFRAGKLKDSRLVAIELFRSHVIMCASPAYIERCGRPKTITDLSNHTLLVPSHHYLPRGNSSSLSSLRSDGHILCDDLRLLVELAKSGAGLAMLWESYAQEELQNDQLIQVESPLELESRTLNMLYISRKYVPRRLSLFLAHVKAHYAFRENQKKY